MAYTPKYDYRAKDALPSGNSAKVIRGTELMEEFEAISAESKSAEVAACKYGAAGLSFAVNVQSVAPAGDGNWRVTFDEAVNQIDQHYAIVVTPAATNGNPVFAYVTSQQESYVDIGFREFSGNSLTVPSNIGFTMIVVDTEV